MAVAAEQGADQVVVTSDNPRSEDPAAIISQILKGFNDSGRVTVQADRALAISHAVARAAAGDVILIAGKGHENYQESAGIKLPFSDKAQAEAALSHGAGARVAMGGLA